MINLEVKLKHGLVWSLLGKFGNFFITFITNIILVRLLLPEDFGLIAIVLFFISIANVLSEGGMSGALIRKENITEKDYSTLFIFNLFVSVFVYFVIFFSAPVVGYFYNKPNLVLVIQVASFVVVINAFSIIQMTRLYRKINYKEVTIYQFISACIANIVSIVIAYENYGIWALVVQQLINSAVFTLILWVKGERLDSFAFSKKSFLDMYQFGIYTTLASILNTFVDNMYQLILGKSFNVVQSGYYYQGKKLQDLPLDFLKSITLGVIFSTLSRLQKNKDVFDNLYNKIHILFSLLIGFTTLFLLIFSKEIVLLLFGEKWIDSVVYIQLLSIASFFYMQEMLNRVLFKVFNQAKKIFQLELVKKGVQLITILIGIHFSSIYILLCGLIFSNFFGYLLNLIFIKKFYESAKGRLNEIKLTLYILFSIGVVFVFYDIFLRNEIDSGYMNLFYVPIVAIIFFIISLCSTSIRVVVIDLVKKVD